MKIQTLNGMLPGNITRAQNGEHVATLIYRPSLMAPPNRGGVPLTF